MRLGLDIGTNSIGWWLYEIREGRPSRVVDGGVRIFSNGRDPQSKASLAVDRRVARAARRRRDRFLRRRASLMKKLAGAGLMPADPTAQKALEQLDPYELRARGLDQALSLPEFGRALFHLNQRRGFKSNRKTDRGDNDAGKIAKGSARLDQAIGASTYGKFLHLRRETAEDQRLVPAVRTRIISLTREDGKSEEAYDFYPSRHHLEDEFDMLWAAQAEYHDGLNDELRQAIFETIFFQRPLKAPKVGRCLYTEEDRLAKAHPLFQRRVLYETVNQLRIREAGQPDRELTLEERDRLILALDGKTAKVVTSANVAFKQLRRAIGLMADQRFSLESEARKGIACDTLRAILAHQTRFGPGWSALSIEAQWEIVSRIKAVETDEEFEALCGWLMDQHGLDRERATATANAPLPDGYGRIGLTASEAILARLEAEVIPYSEAAERAFGHHSDFRTGEELDKLPYYGAILDRHVIPGTNDPNDIDPERYGRITNPTVHIGLGQLRHLLNRIIDHHGKPKEIVVELARDLKLGEKQKTEVQRTIRKNTDAAIRRGEKLEEHDIRNNGANRLMLRLWEELNPDDCMDRRCPYSGEQIGIQRLFSGECDVDHILPFSRTLDDSIANRTICLREANRGKGNRSPWEAWGGTPQWDVIAGQIAKLPKNKQWRFAPDAMERFEAEDGFLDRQLTDTQYLSRIAREYLSRLYPQKDEAPVWVVPGKMTEMLRRQWGLNELLPDHNRAAKAKNRTDHRHHAIDAAVIGATDRGLLQRIQKASRQREQMDLDEVIGDIDPPWSKFREDVAAQLSRITVSHRADHGRIDPAARAKGQDSTTGELHDQTAYGLTAMEDQKGVPLVVTRKPLNAVTPALLTRDEPKKGGMIRDQHLRTQLVKAVEGKEGKEFQTAIEAFSNTSPEYRGIRRVRIIEPKTVVVIGGDTSNAPKSYAPGGNEFYEIWNLPGGKVRAWVVTTFAANRHDLPLDDWPATPATCRRPHPAAKRLVRMYKNDMVRLVDNSGRDIAATVEKFDLSGKIEFVPHVESNAADRYVKDKADNLYIRKTANTFLHAGGRLIIVDETGRVRDPGPLLNRL